MIIYKGYYIHPLKLCSLPFTVKEAGKKVIFTFLKKCFWKIFAFTEKKTYATHLSEVHGEIKSAVNEIQCKSCEMKFAFPNYYIQHHQNEHGSLPPDYIDKELFFCDKCPQVSMMIVLEFYSEAGEIQLMFESQWTSLKGLFCYYVWQLPTVLKNLAF